MSAIRIHMYSQHDGSLVWRALMNPAPLMRVRSRCFWSPVWTEAPELSDQRRAEEPRLGRRRGEVPCDHQVLSRFCHVTQDELTLRVHVSVQRKAGFMQKWCAPTILVHNKFSFWYISNLRVGGFSFRFIIADEYTFMHVCILFFLSRYSLK